MIVGFFGSIGSTVIFFMQKQKQSTEVVEITPAASAKSATHINIPKTDEDDNDITNSIPSGGSDRPPKY